jgi:hypothetical protein
MPLMIIVQLAAFLEAIRGGRGGDRNGRGIAANKRFLPLNTQRSQKSILVDSAFSVAGATIDRFPSVNRLNDA